jgi:hypothetical protein
VAICLARLDDIPAAVRLGEHVHGLTRFKGLGYQGERVARHLHGLIVRGQHKCMRWITALRPHSIAMAFVVAASAGCATGPAFVAPEPPGPGLALVYVYREGSVFGSGVNPQVWVGTRLVGPLPNGGFKRVEVVPAETLILSPSCQPASITLTPATGSSTYVQLELVNKTVDFGGRYYFDYGCRFVQRSEAEALPVLRGLRTIS